MTILKQPGEVHQVISDAASGQQQMTIHATSDHSPQAGNAKAPPDQLSPSLRLSEPDHSATARQLSVARHGGLFQLTTVPEIDHPITRPDEELPVRSRRG